MAKNQRVSHKLLKKRGGSLSFSLRCSRLKNLLICSCRAANSILFHFGLIQGKNEINKQNFWLPTAQNKRFVHVPCCVCVCMCASLLECKAQRQSAKHTCTYTNKCRQPLHGRKRGWCMTKKKNTKEEGDFNSSTGEKWVARRVERELHVADAINATLPRFPWLVSHRR